MCSAQTSALHHLVVRLRAGNNTTQETVGALALPRWPELVVALLQFYVQHRQFTSLEANAPQTLTRWAHPWRFSRPCPSCPPPPGSKWCRTETRSGGHKQALGEHQCLCWLKPQSWRWNDERFKAGPAGVGWYRCLCVTFTKIFSTSGSDSLFSPNFWTLKAATFMVAVKEIKGCDYHSRCVSERASACQPFLHQTR